VYFWVPDKKDHILPAAKAIDYKNIWTIIIMDTFL